jgi:protein-S-isoprenylcysteine O-methyltransferase
MTTTMTMDRIIEGLHPVSEFLGKIQSKLDFDDLRCHAQFASIKGLGRVALLACALGVLWGIHATLLVLLTLESWGWISISMSIFDYETLTSLSGQVRLQMAWQWCCYITAMCTFHLLEFFTTAIYNAKVTSADSYLVNHSKAYTAAFLIAGTEFWFKFLVFPSSFPWICRLGMGMVLLAQMIRSLAMITCGESFNHLIQISKKDNHILITNGIYQWFRHPSYVGFYYWSIGTQLVLNNALSAIVFGSASYMFFRRRIPYEEESLLQHFPNKYVAYVKRTWVGIPFIPSCIAEPEKEKDS